MTKLRFISASLLAASLTAATFAFAVPANAATPNAISADDDLPRVAVNFGDLDLSSAKGRATLDHRIARAVDNVCVGQLSQPDRAAAQGAFLSCRDQALARVSDQLAARGLAGHLAAR